MAIVILTEGGKDKGFGHVSRCLSLYQAFLDRGQLPWLLVNGDASVESVLGDVHVEFIDWVKKADVVISRLETDDVVVIDSYVAPVELYEKIAQKVKVALYFDDVNRIIYPEGVVLNGAIIAEKVAYPKNKDVVYFLGSQYATVRKQFWSVLDFKVRSDIRHICIFLGGNDARGLVPDILKLLDSDYPNVKKSVVIGDAFDNKEEIAQQKNETVNLVYSPDAQSLKQLMLESDLAISAGGQTLGELASVGLPTIGIEVIDNQRDNLTGWSKIGFVDYIGKWDDSDLFKKMSVAIGNLKDKRVREERSKCGRAHMDGQGSLRIVDYLLQQ